MKRVVLIMLVLIITLYTAGCAKVIKTEHETVDVQIVDSYHRGQWMQGIWTGKTMTYVFHPAIYRITVVYNGEEYTINGSETYNTYKDRIGETVSATLEIETYDDGTTRYNITSLA